MKIFLIVTASGTVLSFRRSFIQALQEKGHSVSVIAGDDKKQQKIEALGVDFYCVPQDNRGLDPISMLRYEKGIKKILEQEKPDIVFTFQLKPNVFGVRAAKSAGVEKIYSMVEGAGDVFLKDGIKWKAIRSVVCHLYKNAFQHSDKVFFLNNDDKQEFLRRKLLQEEKSVLINGIGVDLDNFEHRPVKNGKSFLMIARMLESKGIIEYCECARIVKQKHPDATFGYLGSEGTLTVDDIKEYIDDGSINYLGTASDVRPYIEECTAYVLPSYYREGLPMSTMEAEAVGRLVITTDSIGCRETVVDGYNGFLVPTKDPVALAEKCIFVIENHDRAIEMGNNSRKLAENRFDSKKINDVICDIILIEKQELAIN